MKLLGLKFGIISIYFIFLSVFTLIQGSITGNSRLSPDPRIVGGSDAPDGKVPYLVSLKDVYNKHVCGGTIIHARWVLTAANCSDKVLSYTDKSQALKYTYDDDSFTDSVHPTGFLTIIKGSLEVFIHSKPSKVVAGTNRLNQSGVTFYIQKIFNHERWDDSVFMNDISLLKLMTYITFNDLIQPIALPSKDTPAGARLILSGWGTTSFPGNLTNNLQWISLTALSVEDCRSRFSGINPVFDSQICSLTQSGQGACHGDFGGPLTDGFAIVGVVSWGMPCARGYPDVHSRVYAFKDWILRTISNNRD